MKGIILAGGNGTRLYPLTLAVSKQLLPVYDKPLIYYPLSTLMLAGIQDILIITAPQSMPLFQSLLKDGQQWGISITYMMQPEPKGIAHSLLLAESFIGSSPVCLILGDNIFYGQGLSGLLQEASRRHEHGARVFAYYVNDPERYGVVSFDEAGAVRKLVEKPKNPESHFAVTGLYFYDSKAVSMVKRLAPSARGELEVTDLNQEYLKNNALHVEILGRGYCWLDAGTHQTLLDAGNYVATIEKRQGLKVACLEEIAWRMGYVTTDAVLRIARKLKGSYGTYLKGIVS